MRRGSEQEAIFKAALRWWSDVGRRGTSLSEAERSLANAVEAYHRAPHFSCSCGWSGPDPESGRAGVYCPVCRSLLF